MKIEQIEAMRERSGHFSSDCKLTSFLYSLLRDHVQPGEVETIMSELDNFETTFYTNGWLAKYAEDISKRLQNKE